MLPQAARVVLFVAVGFFNVIGLFGNICLMHAHCAHPSGRTKCGFYPKVTSFSEVLPLSCKNRINQRSATQATSSCTQELQALFACLKKWELDDRPCAPQHASYMQCVHTAEKATCEYQEAANKIKYNAKRRHWRCTKLKL